MLDPGGVQRDHLQQTGSGGLVGDGIRRRSRRSTGGRPTQCQQPLQLGGLEPSGVVPGSDGHRHALAPFGVHGGHHERFVRRGLRRYVQDKNSAVLLAADPLDVKVADERTHLFHEDLAIAARVDKSLGNRFELADDLPSVGHLGSKADQQQTALGIGHRGNVLTQLGPRARLVEGEDRTLHVEP
jgi:hypothetical protein